VFELNFHDERYLLSRAPASSASGASVAPEFRQFEYDTITDVVIRLPLHIIGSGDKLKNPASDSVRGYIRSIEDLSREEGLFAAFRSEE